MATLYGPSNPPTPHNYDQFRDRNYLVGYANKIKYDLARLLSVYIGIRSIIYTLTLGDRCPICIDTLTGEKILSNCTTCLGTGYMSSYTSLGETWVGVNIGPAQNIASDMGSTQNQGTKRDVISIVNMPQLHDRDIIILKDARHIYKIEDIEPDIVGLAGIIVLQNVQATFLEPGHITYSLIDW